jgi:hypothetical protein
MLVVGQAKENKKPPKRKTPKGKRKKKKVLNTSIDKVYEVYIHYGFGTQVLLYFSWDPSVT